MSVSNKISQEGTHVECHLLVVLLAQVAYNNERLGILSHFFFFLQDQSRHVSILTALLVACS